MARISKLEKEMKKMFISDGMTERAVKNFSIRYDRSREGRYKKKQSYCHSRVLRAIKRGKLTRKPCAICGAIRTHAHHESYGAPLKVVWLCATHHRRIHSAKYREELVNTININNQKHICSGGGKHDCRA